MPLSNRRGVPVDPVPFFVVAGLTCMVLFSFGPLYGLAFGLSLSTALAVSGALYILSLPVAYHQLVWETNPTVSTPAGPRFERLVYATVALMVLLVALTIPLL